MLAILISSCGAPPPEDTNSATQGTAIIEISASDYSGTAVTATPYVSISNCTSNYTYNSSVASPIALNTIGLALNDSCTFNFQRLVVSGTTYYGITGYMTINSSASTVLKFSSTQGSSAPAIYVNAGTTNVYPSGSLPSFSFLVMTEAQFTSAAASGAFSTVNASSSSGNMGVGAINVSTSGSNILQTGATQTYTTTATNADGSTNATAATWSSSNTSVATIDSTTGVATGVAAGRTTIIATITDTLGTHSTSTALTVRTPYLYVETSAGNIIHTCPISSTGISSCQNMTYTGLSTPAGFFINGNTFYMADGGSGKIFNFLTNTDSTLQKTGVQTSATGLSNLWNVAINGSAAFYSNNSTIFGCDFNTSTKAISGCSSITTSGTNFSSPRYLAVNGGYLYVANFGNYSITSCAISGKTLPSCANFIYFDSPTSIAFYGNFMYVTDFNTKDMRVCTVTNGSFSSGSCTTLSISGIGNPNGLAIFGNYIYISEWTSNKKIWQCTINSTTGILSSCSVKYTSSYGLAGMAIY